MTADTFTERVTPEMVEMSYQHIGYEPAQEEFLNVTSGECCGLMAVQLADLTPNHEPVVILMTSSGEYILDLGPDDWYDYLCDRWGVHYVDGFMAGFDGWLLRPMIATIPYARDTEQYTQVAQRVTEGWEDGRAAALAVGFGIA